MTENKDIKKIEDELEVLLSADKKSWVKIYELMEAVDTQELYKPEYRSFTAWVNALAEKSKVHVSLLWNRKKAGKVYAAYEERAARQGRAVPKMENVKVSADNFNLIEKIAGNNEKVTDELIEKVLQGEMTRSDLKNAWETVKASRPSGAGEAIPTGKQSVRVNAHDKDKIAIEEEVLTAADIVLALSNPSWLPKAVDLHNGKGKESFRVMTEFAVRTGTSRYARRIDAMVLENLTVKEKNYDLHMHAVEIKVSKSDLLGDHKMQEYRDYADYFWIAVPAHLEQDARSIMADGWGLLLMDEKKQLQVAVKPHLYNAVMRDESIVTALMRLL